MRYDTQGPLREGINPLFSVFCLSSEHNIAVAWGEQFMRVFEFSKYDKIEIRDKFCQWNLYSLFNVTLTPLSPLFSVFCRSVTSILCFMSLCHLFSLYSATLSPLFSVLCHSVTSFLCFLPLCQLYSLFYVTLSPLFSVICHSDTSIFFFLPLVLAQ